jgi:two-component system, LytTR family, sensor kinase
MPKKVETGINDRKMLIIGIPLVALLAVLILGKYGVEDEILKIVIPSLGSLISTLLMWLGVRKIVTYLWERYPWEENPVKHLVIEIIAILVYTFLVGGLLTIFWYQYDPEAIVYEDLGINIFFSLIITFLITSLIEGWFFFEQWKKTLVLSEKLEKENIQSQFETLKSQISPHFLFNNLNTLANLIEEAPKVAVEYVQRTADYYRNILNLKDKDVISLEEELKLIEDYYFLQKKRFGSNLNLMIDVPAQYMHKVVAPLTIQMLFENAIKHNIISQDKPLYISIKANDGYIEVENNLQPRETEEKSSRIGLQNISNRYRFLSGKDIVIRQNGATFMVKIPILEFEL